MAFPRLVLPLAAVLSQFVQFALMYVLIVPVLLCSTGWPRRRCSPRSAGRDPCWCSRPASGLLLSAAYVCARDTRHLLEVGLQVWFWLTPIVYAPALVPPRLAPLLAMNPMAWFADAFHGAVVYGRWPGVAATLVLTLCAAASATAGLAIFARGERRFAERI